MKLLSEEKKLKTEQILLTAPVSLFEVIFAKFLAAYVLFAGTFLISCLEFGVLYLYSDQINTAVIISGSVGVLFIGGAFIAIGLFVSSLTENQLTAAVGTIAIIIGFLGIGIISSLIPENYWIRFVFDSLSVLSRFQNLTAGFFELSSFVYYISVSAVFLYFTVRIYDRRRYN